MSEIDKEVLGETEQTQQAIVKSTLAKSGSSFVKKSIDVSL